jgi:dephospho-CoA kinase
MSKQVVYIVLLKDPCIGKTSVCQVFKEKSSADKWIADNAVRIIAEEEGTTKEYAEDMLERRDYYFTVLASFLED